MEMVSKVKKIWRHKKGKWAIIGAVIVLLFTLPVRCDGPYKGQVVEAKTGTPMAGVLVVGYWTYMSAHAGGGTTHCLDAVEMLTDKKGKFEISGRFSALLRPLGSMNITLYKIGYEIVGPMPWESFMIDKHLVKKVKWEAERVIVPLERIMRVQLTSPIGRPPFITCGPKNREPLTEYMKVRREFQRAIEKKP